MSNQGPLESNLWYRVANVKPKLAARASLHRHRYRGELWYLLRDPATGQVHRFTPGTRLMLAGMDGRHTVEALWRRGQQQLGEDAPTQDDLIQLLGQLHGADLLSTDLPPDALESFERGTRSAARKRRRSWLNPMAVRIPVCDPGVFLDRFAPVWQRLWRWPGAMVWLAVVLPALVLLPGAWPELTNNLSDRVLQAENLILLALTFPVIKVLHELGHATATRAAGGEVHDMGVMLLVLMPVPYVDASSASVLRSRWSRALIGAAGMIVELFIAALVFYLWLAVEPGLVRALCMNVMLVAGVSTLLFNGNPLLRYDAYYILTDVIELPNLAQRAAHYWGYLLERYVLRGRHARSPAVTGGERIWFAFYGLASAGYRLFVTFVIALFIATKFFFIGVLLALWAIAAMLILPVWRALRQVRERPGLRERRGTIFAAAGAALGMLALVMTVVPLPHRTQAQGVIWLPEQATLRAGAPGFVSRLAVDPGQRVEAGTVVVHSVNPELDAELRIAEARVAELEAEYRKEFVSDSVAAELVREQLQFERTALDRVRQRAVGLEVAAQTSGVFTVVQPTDMPGRYYRRGDILGYVLGQIEPIVRVVVEQAEVDGVGMSVRRVSMRMADDVGRTIPGRILRQVPAASNEVPSRALVASGGGRLAADPRDPEGRKTLARVFEIDVAPVDPFDRELMYGQRVYVRFDMAPTPLGVRTWRALRRLFLRHFDV